MSTFFPVALGVVAKLYDDAVDIQLDISPIVIESLKSLMIALIVLTTGNDFYLAFSFFVISFFNSGFDNPFWKSIAPVTLLLTLYTFPHSGEYAIYKIGASLVVILGVLVLAMFEDRLFSEEVSIEKITSRIAVCIVLGLMLVLPYMDWFMVTEFSRSAIHTTTIIMFANMLTSVFSMTYLLYYSGKSLQELNPGHKIHTQ